MTFTYQQFLAHHGIKGQRWGVIRTPEELGHDSKKVLDNWARYANSKDRTENENTTPIVKKYRKAIAEVQHGGRNKVMDHKTGDFNDKAFEKNKISAKQAARIVNKDRDWLGEISGAMLRDMGYKDTKEAREWLKKQPWMQDLWTPVSA